MGVRCFGISLVLACAVVPGACGTARAVTRVQGPNPFRIWVSAEEEKEQRLLEAIGKLRRQEERLSEFLGQLRNEGLDVDDPGVFLIYRQLRDLRRQIWRLERDRFR